MNKQARVIVTQKDSAYKLTEISPLAFKSDPELENKAINIYPEIKFQEIIGFGGAITESVHDTIARVSEANRQKILELYFDKEKGIGYELIRTHLNSCDFSLGNYAYVKGDDRELKSFDLSRDIDSMFKTILMAQKIGGKDVKVLVSPWSPPAFMKTNGQMNHGGKLREDCKRLWAEYIAKYIRETRKLGISVWAMTIQNEPKAMQIWDSCIYTAQDEAEFIKDHLIPVFRDQQVDIKVLIWDHNKERILERAVDTFTDLEVRKFVWGVAFHWYSGDHFEAVGLTHRLFPEKALMMSEGCMEKRIYAQEAWSHGEHYAHDIIGNLNNYMGGYFDWNILLDERGGPNHVNNFCSAPIMADTANDKIHLNASYYYIGHFSKFIPAGSKRIGFSKYNKALEVTAFLTPEGKTVVVVMNPTDDDLDANIRQRDLILPLAVKAHSIVTVVF
jgi:glucosylceramidase